MSATAGEIATAYYEMAGFQPLRTSKKLMPDCERYRQWCEDNKVDPIVFMRFRFRTVRAVNPKARPPMRSMGSIKTLKKWGVDVKNTHAQEKHEAKLKKEMITVQDDTLIGLMSPPSRSQEFLRASYLTEDKTLVCMHEPRYTGGYDPRSKTCVFCPRKHECLLLLNNRHGFDVGALRVGMLHMLPTELADRVRRLRRAKP